MCSIPDLRQSRKFAEILCWLMFAICLQACSSGDGTKIPDVSHIKVDVELTRFEQLLLADTMISAADIYRIQQEHPAFAEIYFRYVVPAGDDLQSTEDDEGEIARLQEWIRHPRTRWLYDTVQTIFPDVSFLEKDLETTFKYARYYFPETNPPKVYTTISDFGYFPFLYAEDSLRDGIGISLELFLGEDFPYRTYTGLNNAFSDYLIRSYNRDHMVRRVLEVWIEDLAGPPPGNRLIDYMIHNGKKLFIMESLMPNVSDTVIMDYSLEKMNWAKTHERDIWYHFTTGGWLYETAMTKIQKYIGPSPSSPGMPRESPGNTGSWLGWQIVRAYMKKHPEVSLKDLLKLDDAQKILDMSGYRPPR